MKYIVLMMLVCGLAYPSGKLSLTGSYFAKADKVAPKIGLSVYEKITGPLNYSAWTGFGWQPRVVEPSVFYFVTSHAAEVWLGDIGASLGYAFRHASQQKADLVSEHEVFAKLQYKLW